MAVSDLQQWLEGLGLGQYAAAFVANDIDTALLGQLTDADLKDLGVASLGHRKRLLAAIAECTARVAAPAAAVPIAGAVAGERRQVTILFADLSGFTALAQSLDPEEGASWSAASPCLSMKSCLALAAASTSISATR